jgi:outer membrane protein assembly factor BamE (lipoprotein component of BamABCDE complex)
MIRVLRKSLLTALFLGFALYSFSSGTLAAGQSAQQNDTPAAKDKSQWRKLQRHMSRDDVKKLLGEPDRVSVSRFSESWYYLSGSVTFDGKGHVDFWSEP